MIRVEAVSVGSSLLAQLIELWRVESRTLGFMPRGGFEEAARKGCLLAAVDSSATPLAYVLYRQTTRQRTAIVHLCVAPAARGRGLARQLIDEVKSRAVGSFELRLLCRRDFDASKLWPKLGFVPVGDQPGKAKNAVLTTWRYEMAALPLFQVISSVTEERALRAVIDANIFFDLDEQHEAHEESRALRADWLSEVVELALTEEILTEINRRDSPSDRARQRARAERFARVPRNVAREDQVFPFIRALLPQNDKPSTTSDARQLAMTVAAGVTFFVTRDERVLDTADQLYEAFDLRVVPPHELILRFDELRREQEYRPKRLFLGPTVRTTRPRAEDLERLADLFRLGHAVDEPRRQTIRRLRELLASPDRVQAACVEKDGDLLAAYFLDRSTPATLTVPYLATSATSLGKTAARHYSEHLVGIAAAEGRHLIRIRDGGPRVAEALADAGFSRDGDHWVKLVVSTVARPLALADAVEQLSLPDDATFLKSRVSGELRSAATLPGGPRQRAALVASERTLWPAKIEGTGLPCYLVPIQPRWAKDLFDLELATGTLFGGDAGLVLNSENVYYRAPRPAVVTGPARVLWYVSKDKDYPGSMAMRAASYVDEVVVGRPKDIFRRFGRIGIYKWSEVLAVAKGDLDAHVMAFRFVRTEQMRVPVQWDPMQKILLRHIGKKQPLVSPLAVSEACFLELYRLGLGNAPHAA